MPDWMAGVLFLVMILLFCIGFVGYMLIGGVIMFNLYPKGEDDPHLMFGLVLFWPVTVPIVLLIKGGIWLIQRLK